MQLRPSMLSRTQLIARSAAVLGLVIAMGAARAERPVGKSGAATPRNGIVVAGDCADNDGDTYGVGAGCAGADCDDDNASVHPGAAEICNGIDDDCEGGVDEGFVLLNGRDGDPDSPTFLQYVTLPSGAACVNGFGICAAVGTVVCNAAGDAVVCDAVPGPADPRGEGLDGDGIVDVTVETCFDRLDNDCDGLVDHGGIDETDPNNPVRVNTNCTGAELCDGFDNNNDGQIDEGLGLGDACTVGTGACLNSGTSICDGNGGLRCNAIPLSGQIENLSRPARCTDGVDNDCDGDIDIGDTGCQSDEICDGKDNDGDGFVDEDFVGDLGQLCVAGIGPCQGLGFRICSADGSTTACSAVASQGSPEGPGGPTCSDGIDNDCDGLTDAVDAACAASGLTVSCALPYDRGNPGNDCTGWHRIRYSHNGGPAATVTAELLGLDADGNILEEDGVPALLSVRNGEEAHLASRVSPDDWKWTTRKNARGVRHEMFATVPMLHVVVEDGLGKAEAFCSNIPFLNVTKPSGAVVSGSGTDIEFFAAIPQVDPDRLAILVNGVNILQPAPTGLGLDPVSAFPGGPYSGTVQINGGPVTVTDLIVRSAPIDQLSSNTVSMVLSGLGCGSHVITVDGEWQVGAFPKIPGRPSSACLADDVLDRGTAMVFKIEITQPSSGEVTPPGPVHVVGEACHGVPMASASINGFPIPTAGQTCVGGDPILGGGLCTLPIDVNVPMTDLRAAVDSGGGVPGSFDPGPNRLVAQALDGDFNAAFDNFFFAVGPVIANPSTAIASGASRATAYSPGPVVVAGPAPGDVSPAFVLSLTEVGINTFFEAMKNTNERCLGDRAERSLDDYRNTKELDVECDPPTTMVINNTEIRAQDFSLSVDLEQDLMHVRIGLPPIDLLAHFSGYCQSGCVCAFGGCACAVCVTVDLDATLVQRDMSLSFDVTEDRIHQTGVPRDQREPLDINFDFGTNDPDESVHIGGEVDVGCLLGFLLDLVSFFVLVFTLGFVDLNLSNISFEMTQEDIEARLDEGRDGDPMDVDFAKFKNDDLPEFGTRQRDSRVDDVQITPTGLSIGIGASFEPDPAQLDPGAANIPGTPVDLAPLPQSPILATDGLPVGMVTLAFSDDLFNQLFNSMVATGRLRTNFEVTRTLGDFIPENCDDITDVDRRARCIGFRAADPPASARFCGRFDGFTDACEAAFPYGLGDDDPHRRQCCRAGRIRRTTNIRTATTIILQGIIHNPPQLLINDIPGTPDIETVLRFPQISLHLIADRDNNGVLNTGTLESLPDCSFGDLDAEFGTQTTVATECVLWETCPTVDLNLGMQIGTNPNSGRDRIQFNFGGVTRSNPYTVSCGGTEPIELDFFNESAGRTETFDILDNQLRDRTPPLEHDGLELGGFVTFDKDRIIAIETDNDPNGFQDYIGITGNLVPNPVDPNETCEEP